MLLASMGVPSLLLQLDSRASVIDALDESYVTPSIQIDQLSDMCLKRIEGTEDYRHKIRELKLRYIKDYEEMFGRLGLI